MEGRSFLLLALACASLFGAVFAQDCSAPLPDMETILSRLQAAVEGSAGEGPNPVIELLQYNFNCIAVGTTEGTARSLSIAVRYNVTSTSQPEVQRISQLLLECTGGNFVAQGTPLEPFQSETLLNPNITRRDCRFCIRTGPNVDTNTNCAGKSKILYLTLTTLLFLSF